MSNIKTETKKEVKNARGKVMTKTVRISGKNNKRLDLSEIDKIYKQLSRKYNKKNFLIRAMGIDGMTTLKSQDFIEDELKFMLENYYRSYGIQANKVKEKFNSFYFIDVTVIN